MSDLAYLTIAEASALLRDKKLSPVEWTQALIAWLVLRRDPFYAPFELHGRGLDAPERKSLGAHLRLGLPMGAAILIEVSGFSFEANEEL